MEPNQKINQLQAALKAQSEALDDFMNRHLEEVQRLNKEWDAEHAKVENLTSVLRQVMAMNSTSPETVELCKRVLQETIS
jgi:hypothetical protein